MPSRSASRSDQGSGTVLVVAAVSVVLTVTMAALVLGSAVVGSHRARSAADLGALAGARSAQSGSPGTKPCAEAARVARANGATVSSCSLVGVDVWLAVTVPAWPTGSASARARAGPARSG